MNSFFLQDIEFLSIVKEQVIFENSSGSNEGGGSGRGRMSCYLIARMGVFVRTTSDFMTYEALIVMHVLRTLGRRELEGINIHSVGVTMGER